MSTSGAGAFVEEHPWMTFFLGVAAIRTVGAIFDGHSKTIVTYTPQTPHTMPTTAVAGVSTGALDFEEIDSEETHPWFVSAETRSADDEPIGPAIVKFGPITSRVRAGRQIVLSAPASLGVLQPPGLYSTDPAVVAPMTLANGEQGFLAMATGTAVIRGRYASDDGFPYDAAATVEVVGA